ncbi:MAG: phosphatase PAP2 family protein [Candidatus Paceibacterota bacterium]
MDTQIFFVLNNLAGQSPVFNSAVVFLASYLPYLLVVLLLALVFFSQYSKREKWQILLIVGISALVARFGVTELIRLFIHRPRPFLAMPVHQLLTDSAWSFPSGHATFFFALSTAVYLYNKKWGVWFFVATVLITVSRVIAGIHYPSDIIGGALIGSAVAYVTYRIFSNSHIASSFS